MRQLLIIVITLGVLVPLQPVWADVDNLEGKGPPDKSRYSGMSWKIILSKANQMYEIANLDKAAEYAAQLTIMEPNIPGGWRIAGLVRSDRREYEAAAADLEKCIRLSETYFGKDVKSLQYDYESLGYVYKRLNRLDEAIKSYKKAVAIDPTKGYFIDQLVRSCQWKYAHKYANLDQKIFVESDFREDYQISELAEEKLIIREFRHTDGGRWAMEEQKISIMGDKRVDHVILSCERDDATQKIKFHISYGSDNSKRLEEITDRYRAALRDKDPDIRIFAASQLKLLNTKWITTLSQDPDSWVRLSALRFLQENKPEMKLLQDFLIDSDPLVSRLAVAIAKSISKRQSAVGGEE